MKGMMQDDVLSGSLSKDFLMNDSPPYISLRLISKVNSGIRSTLYRYRQCIRPSFDLLLFVLRRKRRVGYPIAIEHVHIDFAHNRNSSSMLGIGISSSNKRMRG